MNEVSIELPENRESAASIQVADLQSSEDASHVPAAGAWQARVSGVAAELSGQRVGGYGAMIVPIDARIATSQASRAAVETASCDKLRPGADWTIGRTRRFDTKVSVL
jgi:hypothetical protein